AFGVAIAALAFGGTWSAHAPLAERQWLKSQNPGLRVETPSEIQLADVPVAGELEEVKKPRAARLRPVRAPAKKTTGKQRDCTQLYYTDATGIRRVKRHCL